MEITIRYFDGCPNWKLANARVREAAAGADLPYDVVITLENVGSLDDAVALGFRGSPTILIDGQDPFDDGSSPVGLSCRVYRTEVGMEGSPSIDQLRQALRAST